MKKFICCLVCLLVVIIAVFCISQMRYSAKYSSYGVQVDWDEPWIFNGETLYFGTYIENYEKETVGERYLTRSQWETIIEARSKGFMVNPL